MNELPPVSRITETCLVGRKFYGRIVSTQQVLRKKSKSSLAQKRVRFIVPPWGWVDYNVQPMRADRIAIGVVDPSKKLSLRACARSQERGRTGRVIAYGCALEVLFVACALVAKGSASVRSSYWLMLVAMMLAIGLAVTSMCLSYRSVRPHCKSLDARDATYELVLSGLARYAQIQERIQHYRKKMKTAADGAALQPIALPSSIDAALLDMRTSAWNVAIGREGASDQAVLAGFDAIANAVLDAIATAWQRFESYTIPIPNDEESSVDLVKHDTALYLQRAAEMIQADREVDQSVSNEIGRINRAE